MTADCRVVLVGMMGSGKSTVGVLLAQRTGWRYYDNDELLERLRGETAKTLLTSQGEVELRSAEADALRLGLRQQAPCIVAAPAGAVLNAQLRDELSGALVVWLTAEPRTLARRARDARHRPWLDGDAEAWMKTTLAERAPLYGAVADLSVDTDDAGPDTVAALIAEWLAERCA